MGQQPLAFGNELWVILDCTPVDYSGQEGSDHAVELCGLTNISLYTLN